MFKKATIALFCFSVISQHAFTMNQIPDDAYVPLIQKGDANIYSDALKRANEIAGYISQNLSEGNFKSLYQASLLASRIYVALIDQEYQEAFQPAIKLAEKLCSYQGTNDIDIPSLDQDGTSGDFYTQELLDQLKISSEMSIWVCAARIYVAWIENNDEKVSFKECFDKLFAHANDFFAITIKHIDHQLHDKFATLNEEAAKIYAKLIYHGYEKADEKGQEIADILSADTTSYFHKISASHLYAALIEAEYNFQEVCESAAKLARTQKNTDDQVALINYTALVGCEYESVYQEVSEFLKEKKWPDFGYNSNTIDLIYKLCAALVLNVESEVERLNNYAHELLRRAEKEGFYLDIVSYAMPLFEALNKHGQLSDEDLALARKLAKS